eukprot:6916348-Pyramimonas_sp.AAC.1
MSATWRSGTAPWTHAIHARPRRASWRLRPRMMHAMLSLLGLRVLGFSLHSGSSSATSRQGVSPRGRWAARPRPAPAPQRWSRTCAPQQAGVPFKLLLLRGPSSPRTRPRTRAPRRRGARRKRRRRLNCWRKAPAPLMEAQAGAVPGP